MKTISFHFVREINQTPTRDLCPNSQQYKSMSVANSEADCQTGTVFHLVP